METASLEIIIFEELSIFLASCFLLHFESWPFCRHNTSDSSSPGDNKWQYWTRSTLVRVLACWQTAPRHYLNQSSGLVFGLLLRVCSDYAQPITGQVTELTCPEIGQAQPELTPSKRQETGRGLRAILQYLFKISILEMSLRIMNLRLQPYLLMSWIASKTQEYVVGWGFFSFLNNKTSQVIKLQLRVSQGYVELF